jgi:hypothetical protein
VVEVVAVAAAVAVVAPPELLVALVAQDVRDAQAAQPLPLLTPRRQAVLALSPRVAERQLAQRQLLVRRRQQR